MKPESVSKSLRIGFGPYTDASLGWPKLASVDATEARRTTELPWLLEASFAPLMSSDIAVDVISLSARWGDLCCPNTTLPSTRILILD